MADYVLWQRGIHGPELAIKRGHCNLNEHERKNRIGDPIEIPQAHKKMGIDQLRKHYPAPAYGSSQ